MLKFSTFLTALLLACVLGANAQNISVNPMSGCTGSSSEVSYTGSAASSYSWDFGMGASPATAMTEGPHNVMWSSPGMKTITLTTTVVTSGSSTFLVLHSDPAVGSGSDNFVNTVFADAAAQSITAGTAPYTGMFRPLGGANLRCNVSGTTTDNFAGFEGINPNGNWILHIFDDLGADVGTLVDWTITFPQGSFSANPNAAIPDNGCTSGNGLMSMINVSGIPSPLSLSNASAMTVTVNVPHTWVGDVVMFLESPSPTTTVVETYSFNVGATPVALNTGNPTSTSVNLFWQPVAGVSQWRIGYRVVGANMWNYTPNVTASMSGGNLFRTVNGLQTGSMYEFVVMPAGSDCMSNIVTGSTAPQGAQTCRSMTDVYVNVESSSSATLYWEVDGGMNNCAIVQYGPRMNSITTWTIQTVPGGMTPYDGMYTLSGLQPGVEYGFRVMNNCTACSPSLGTRSAWSAIYYFTPMTMPMTKDMVASVGTTHTLESLSVYPNPNKGTFSLRYEAENAGENSLQVLDMNGRVVVNETIAFEAGLNEIPVDITAKTAGIYFVKFGTKTVKVVVQ